MFCPTSTHVPIAAGVDLWVEVTSRSVRHTTDMRATWIGVVTAGHWTVGAGGLERDAEPGQIIVMSPTEIFSLAGAPTGQGVASVIWLSLAPTEDAEGEIVFRDRVLFDEPFARTIADATADAAATDVRAIQTALDLLVARHASVHPNDALAIAKAEIDRTFADDMYIDEYAATAQTSQGTFTRAFTRRYGVTPVHYRLRRRLAEAMRLMMVTPERSLTQIAIAVGFGNARFFRRALQSACRASPTALRALVARVAA
jgi:methylphosphotriester-DNA--protein-cysteine methyltransferase